MHPGKPRWCSGKERICHHWRCKRSGFDPWVRKIPWRRAWQPIPVFLPGEPHGQRSLVGYSPQRPKEWDTTEAAEQQQGEYNKWRQPGSSIHTRKQRQTFAVKGCIVTLWSSVGHVVSVSFSIPHKSSQRQCVSG